MLHYSESTAPKIKKYLTGLMVISCTILYAVYTLAIAPLYSYISSNVVFSSTWLPFAVRLVLEILDIAIFAFAYFAIIYAFFRFTKKKSIARFPIVYLIITLIRRTVTLIVQWIGAGSIGSDDYISIVVWFAIDAVQVGIVLAIVAYERHKFNDFLKTSKTSPRSLKLLPFKKVYDKNNPLQICMLRIAILISGIKIVTRIISDIQYGAPRSFPEGLVMVIYYLADLLNGIAFYAMVWGLFALVTKIISFPNL